jgi:hypothetical protein
MRKVEDSSPFSRFEERPAATAFPCLTIEQRAAATLYKTAHLPEIIDAVRRLRTGETLLAMDEVVGLLEYARRRRDQQHDDRKASREPDVPRAPGPAGARRRPRHAGRGPAPRHLPAHHVASILAKLGVHSQLQAVLFALRYGAVDLR